MEYRTPVLTNLAGSQAPAIAAEVSRLITTPVIVCDDWVAARGCARIARDVFAGGVTSVLGLRVDR